MFHCALIRLYRIMNLMRSNYIQIGLFSMISSLICFCWFLQQHIIWRNLMIHSIILIEQILLHTKKPAI